jgi:ADP-heptose:LPS heptosyltransferase
MVYTPTVLALPPFLSRKLERQGVDLTLLVIRLGAMGDILRTIPAVRLLRRKLPRARIIWLADQHWSQLLEGHEDLDAVIRYPRKRWDALLLSPLRWYRFPYELREFRGRMRRERCDMAIDFQGNLRSGCVCRLSGAPVRVGYRGHQQRELNRLFTTHHVLSGSRRTPRMERNLDVVRALGLESGTLPDAALPVAGSGAEAAAKIIADLPDISAPYAVIAPGASRAQAYKKPPPELLGAACRKLLERGIKPLVVYGPGEEKDGRAVLQHSEGGAVLAPPTTLQALAALLKGAKLFVGGDSGPMHMACAVGCPVLCAYGPTDPVVNQPWGVPHRVLFPAERVYTGVKRLDRKSGGFSGLTAEHVSEAVAGFLEELERLTEK